jgi:hypothetical protein
MKDLQLGLMIAFACTTIIFGGLAIYLSTVWSNERTAMLNTKRYVDKGIVYSLVVDSIATDSLHEWRK